MTHPVMLAPPTAHLFGHHMTVITLQQAHEGLELVVSRYCMLPSPVSLVTIVNMAGVFTVP